MSYRGDLPPISFAGIHTACISGDNGAGKSSLIDAMTWALWGKTRAPSEDDLISLGADETEVEFDFNASGNHYRVIRKRTKGKRPGSASIPGLDLLVLAGEDFKPITGDTISKTQDAIKTLLRMDYDTFINSAYLRQGHADEFTRQTPAKRKEVLGSILKLEVYEELVETARLKSRELATDKASTQHQIVTLSEELEKRDEISEELRRATERFNEAEKKLRETQASLDSFREKKLSLQSREDRLKRLKIDSDERAKQLSEWEESARTTRMSVSAHEELISQSKAIEEGFQRYATAKKDFERMVAQLKKLNILSEQKNTVDKTIQAERARMRNRIDIARQSVKNLEEKAAKLSGFKLKLNEAELEEKTIQQLEIELEKAESQIKSLESEQKENEIESARAKERIREIEDKVDLISDNTEPHCPLCEKSLNNDERLSITAKYSHEKEHLLNVIKKASENHLEVQTALNEKRQAFSQDKARIEALKIKNKQDASLLRHRIQECIQSQTELELEQKTLHELVNTYDSGEYAVTEQARLAEITAEIALIDYNEEAYQSAHETINKTEYYQEQHLKLVEASRQIGSEQEKLAQAEKAISSLRDRISLDTAEIRKLEEELKSLLEIDAGLKKAEALKKEADDSAENNRTLVYKLKAQMDTLSITEKKLAELRLRLKEVASEESILKNLIAIFGKNGIQSMLIELAIPEIENEANRVLGKMTDNRMALKLELEKPKKAGGTAQTLDIKIGDDVGTRDYEMYSGGEAFRIDFALRIALAKLLANRSGAPLPTLIIDEGFGTQDSIGLEKVKEAINAIQDDFEIILVITHIDELKNAFNNRIEVSKTQEGSTVSIF
jgi:exonuclease SbcC